MVLTRWRGSLVESYAEVCNHTEKQMLFCTHVVSIFIGDSCRIKQNLIKLQLQKYCHFVCLTTKFIFLHD